MFMKGDFHIHSTASDGSLTPEEIVLLAKSRGIDTIAISDHNSIDGIDCASEAGKKYDISVIPAVELSTRFNDESIHILGYFKNKKYSSAVFKQILKLIKNHEAYKLRDAPFESYKHKKSIKYLSSAEGISLLKSFGAAAVLAHPVRISKKNLPDLLKMPFDGIEARYCNSNDYYTNLFIKVASEKFSFYTGGSDFHTNKIFDYKHGLIGNPCLNSDEIQKFLKNSEAIILDSNNNN